MKRMGILLVLALGLFAPALVTKAGEEKKLSDADIAKLLVGKWRLERGEEDRLVVRVTMTFDKDQTFSLEAEDLEFGGKVTAAGTWKVEKGDVVMTAKESTYPKNVGKVGRTKVVSIDDSTFKFFETGDPGAPVKEVARVFKKVK